MDLKSAKSSVQGKFKEPNMHILLSASFGGIHEDCLRSRIFLQLDFEAVSCIDRIPTSASGGY